MIKNQTALTQIENYVLSRKTEFAKKKIQLFLNRQKKQASAIFLACDWYRRLGLFQDALDLVLKQEPFEKNIPADSVQGLKLLWAARLLNQLGASNFAYSILKYININTLEAHQIAGAINLSNFNFQLSLFHYSKYIEIHPNKNLYQYKISSLGYSDSLAGLKDYERAIQWAEKIFATAEEPLLKGIALQAQGEYLAQSGHYKKAFDKLIQAKIFFPLNDQSPDYSFLMKWLGYASCMLGDVSFGKNCFETAISIQKKSKIREEALFSTYKLMDKVQILPIHEQNLINYYPLVSSTENKTLSKSTIWENQNSRMKVNFSRSEYILDEKIYLNLPKEIMLIAWLRIAEEFGISEIKAMTILWPDEVFSFRFLHARLAQIITRIRHELNIHIFVKDKRIYLAKEEYRNISVEHGSIDKPSFLKSNFDFNRSQVEQYYNLSKTNSLLHLDNWQKQGWVQSYGNGPSKRYRISS